MSGNNRCEESERAMGAEEGYLNGKYQRQNDESPGGGVKSLNSISQKDFFLSLMKKY